MTPEHAAALKPGIRAAAWIAWSVCALSVAFAALGLLFLFLHGSFAVVINDESVGVNAVVAVVFPMVGALIASRHPGNAIGWIFCAIGLFEGASTFAGEYGRYVLQTEPNSLPAGVAAVWIGTWAWVPGVGLTTTFLLLLFPHGRLPSRRWRPVAWLAALGITLGAVTLAILPWDLLDVPAENPLGVEAARNFEVVLAISAGALWTVSTLLCLFALAVRFRRSRGEERQQLKWFVYAGAVTVAFFFVPLIPQLSDIGTALQIATAPFLPAAAGIAILKHRLSDIDFVINRTLVYGALTACVVGIYVLVVGYLGALFQARGNLAVSLGAAGVVAVLFAPLRERLQRAVNRLMYGERDEPYVVVSRLGERLEATLAPNAVLPAAVRTVAEALKLPFAAVEVGRDGVAFETAAATGERVPDPLRLPLVYGGETVGRLVLGRRPGEADFSPADRRLLDNLARQIGVAVHAAHLTGEAIRLSEDLRRSRAELVTAREEERRRLRRDLHDGLGPQLASLAMKAEAARDLLPADPTRSDALLADVTEQTQAAVSDVRRLVYGLRPPALDDLGLVGALRAHAAHGEHGGLHVAIEAPKEMPALPAAVEVAAYRIAIEALNNVACHAHARSCTLRFAPDEVGGALRLEVTDDGRGIPEDRRAGVGLSSMRERAEELGGSLTVEALPSGGTRVAASLPLVRSEDEAARQGPKEG